MIRTNGYMCRHDSYKISKIFDKNDDGTHNVFHNRESITWCVNPDLCNKPDDIRRRCEPVVITVEGRHIRDKS